MTKVQERRLALELRKQGKSYSQIKNELGISKSTLSGWLRNYPLSKDQIDALRGRNPRRIEKYRITMQRKREDRLSKCYQEEKSKWVPLSNRELFIAGLFLYWGEGSKSLNSQTSLNNTDPNVVKFFLIWLIKALSVSKEKIKVFLHLYKDMNVVEETKFWSKQLDIPLKQFNKPYIKDSKISELDQKSFRHGTCTLVVNNARLKERIIMAIKAIGTSYTGEPSN